MAGEFPNAKPPLAGIADNGDTFTRTVPGPIGSQPERASEPCYCNVCCRGVPELSMRLPGDRNNSSGSWFETLLNSNAEL